jgi:hypothetical protein
MVGFEVHKANTCAPSALISDNVASDSILSGEGLKQHFLCDIAMQVADLQ